MRTLLHCIFFIFIGTLSFAQVTSVDYLFDYDTVTCKYQTSIIVNAGSASTNQQLFQLSSAAVVVSPEEITISNVTSINPTPNMWDIGQTYLAPGNNTNFNYYQIVANFGTGGFYDPMSAGDTILLFTFEASDDMHGPNGIRTLLPTENIPITNNFKLASTIDILDSVRQDYPSIDYAEADHVDIFIGTTANLTPTTGGAWSNSDPTVASFANNVVTGLTEGTTLLTFTPSNGDCPSNTYIRVTQNDPISEVDYQIDYNESECVYDCKVVINDGAAISNTEKIQLGSTFSIVIPIEANILDVTSVTPSAITWELKDSVISPVTDPLHKYYQITTDGLPVEMHSTLVPGDTVLLFKVELDYNFHSQEGIRNLVNGVDLIGSTISLDNDFNLGAVNHSYNTNLPIQLPNEYAELTGNDTILIGESMVVNPSTGGTYSSNDPTIASVNGNTITGVSAGSAIITYMQTNGCESSVKLEVTGSDPLDSVNYRIVYDETTNLFNCYLKAISGNALTMNERLQGSATFSIVIPKDVSLTLDSSVSPSSDAWQIGDVLLEPAEDSTRNYYQITTDAQPVAFYDQIFESDSILLFKISLSHNTHGANGIRNFVNGVDLIGNAIDISNDFNIGANSGIYNTNEPPVAPDIYADAASYYIDAGTTTTITPTSGGTWTTNGSSAASFDPATHTVTGLDDGTILLTFTPNSGNLININPSSVVIRVGVPPHDPISEVDYQLKFNETTCNYDCYMKVITGSAITTLERIQFGSSYTIVTPAETELNFEGSVAPTSIAWSLNQTELAPAGDPTHNFYHFITSPSSANVHDFLYPGDEVLLFSVSTDDNIQGPDGIRIFDNTIDIPNVPVAMENEFNIGSIDDQYRQNINPDFPSTYAEVLDGRFIDISETTELSPSWTNGSWTSSNAQVVLIENNNDIATGIGEGYSILTFTPNNGDCPSSVVVHVTNPPHDPISEVDYKIKYNEALCHYEAYMVIKTGSALTQSERLAFASSYTVVTSPHMMLTFKDSHAPSSLFWDHGVTELQPSTDPDKNFFHFVSYVNSTDFYDFLFEGDEVLLFTFEADYDLHYLNELRIFDSSVDNPIQSIQNEINIGGITGQYNTNLPGEFPLDYADITNTSSIYVTQSTTLSATGSGSWSSSDPTIATIDAVTGEVTGVALGSAYMTFTPTDNTICPSSVFIEVIQHETLTEVEYLLTWDEVNEEYIASFKAIKGNAISSSERLQFGSTFSIVTPSLVTPTIVSTNPSSSTWNFGDIILSPPSDPYHNFYQVTTDGLPAEQHGIVLEGDVVELFRISMDYNVHGSNGLRILENGVDLIGNPLDINNEFNLGAINGQYQQNAPTILPSIYAETNTDYIILTSTTTNVTPISGGVWTNSNPSVVGLASNGEVTGLTVGTSILTYDPGQGIHPSSVVIYVEPNQNSSITAIDFKLEFDDSTCDTYNCYMVIKEGSAYSAPNLFQGNATYTIVTPKDVTISFDESVSPNSSTWYTGASSLAPPEDPLHNFFSFYPTLGSTNIYNPLVEGDEVLLFTVTSSSLAHGPKGIRLFVNGMDIPNSPGSFDNGITIGGVNQLYNTNLPGMNPSNYAEAIGPSNILIGGQTTLIPNIGGTWSNNNPAVATMDNDNVVTGLALGTAVFTFSPDGGNSCDTEFSVNVVESIPSIAVGIGTLNPSSSALLDVYSTDKGILIPRMSQSQRLCIPSPPDGLLVYQIDQNSGFYYFDGASWTRLDDTLTNGTSNAQGSSSNTSNLQINNTDLLNELQKQQNELEQKLKEQEAKIKALKKSINQ